MINLPCKNGLITLTNSANTTLTINAYVNSSDNTKGDVINHYDDLDKLAFTEVVYSCY